MAGEEMERAFVLGLLLGRPKRMGDREKTGTEVPVEFGFDVSVKCSFYRNPWFCTGKAEWFNGEVSAQVCLGHTLNL